MTMEDMKLVVASKLIKLRQQAGMTQAELGEKLNYSDKTVSKWERAESMPDVYVLSQIAQIYGVTVDGLLSGNEPWMDPIEKEREAEKASAPKFSSAVVTCVAIAGIWTMAVLMFVIFWLAIDVIVWQIFATAVPVSLIVLLVLNTLWNRGRHNMIIVMLLVACIVALVYLFLLPFNPWQIFLVLVPAEILTALCFHIRLPERKKREKSELSES